MLVGHGERVVTLLLTDIEGSTAAWDAAATEMARRLEEHDRLVRSVVEQHGGTLVKSKGEGDSTFSVFDLAHDAVTAAVDLQRGLAQTETPLRVRAAIHSGPVYERDGDYFGPVPNTTARVRGTAHGGQIIATDAVSALCEDRLPAGITLRMLGTFRLRDVSAAVRLHQVDHPELVDRFPPLRSVESMGTALPVPLTRLIGREMDTQAVAKAVGEERLVTLTGLGGIGKTRLALAAAESLRESFEDGVWWVELDKEVGGVAETVASQVGAKELAATSATDRAVAHCRSWSALVILDNCEHVVEEAGELCHRLLTSCPGIKVLATSRESLDVPGEVVVNVRPLDTADEASPAVRLLHDLTRGSVDAEAALTLARRLDGVPLAIELVAAQLSVLGSEQVLGRLDDALSHARRRAGPERHRTLRAALEGSYGLLDAMSRRAFRLLSVFPTDFPLEGAGAVVEGDAMAAVTSLVRTSLLSSEDGRFRMLAPVRQYGRELLATAGEEQAAFTRLLAWTATRERDEQPAVGAALRWALDVGRDEDAARLLVARRRAWLASGWTDARQHVLRVRTNTLPPALGAQLTALAAELARRTGDVVEAEALAQRAEQEASAIGDVRTQALAAMTRLGVKLNTGAVEEGEAVGVQAAELARQIGDVGIEGIVLNFHGAIAATAGDFSTATERWERSTELLRQTADQLALTSTVCNLAFLQYARGDLDRATELAEEALRLAQEEGTEGPMTFAIGLLGRIRYEFADLDEAEQLLREAIRLERVVGIPAGSSNADTTLASLLTERGDLDSASDVIDAGLREATNRQDVRRQAFFLFERAQLEFALGSPAEAVETSDLALSLFPSRPDFAATTLLTLARVEATRDKTRAARLLGAAAAIARHTAMPLRRVERVRFQELKKLLEPWSGEFEEGKRLSVEDAMSLVGQRPPVDSQTQSSSGS